MTKRTSSMTFTIAQSCTSDTSTRTSLSADTSSAIRYPKDYFEFKRALMKSSLSMKAKMLCEALAGHGLRNSWSSNLMAEMSASINTVTAAKREAMAAGWLIRVFEGGPGSGKRDEFDLVIPVNLDDEHSHNVGLPFTTGVTGIHKSCEPDTPGDTTGKATDDERAARKSSSPSGKSASGQSPDSYVVTACQRLNEHLDQPLDAKRFPSSAKCLLQRMYPDPEDIPARELGQGHLEDAWFNSSKPRYDNEASVLASNLKTASQDDVRSWIERGAQRVREEEAEKAAWAEALASSSGQETEPVQVHQAGVHPRMDDYLAKRQAKKQAEDARQAEERRLKKEIEDFWPRFEAVNMTRDLFDSYITYMHKTDNLSYAQILARMPKWLAGTEKRIADREVAV